MRGSGIGLAEMRRGFLLFWGQKLSVIEVMTVWKGIYWVLRIIAIVLFIKFGLWAYQSYKAGDQGHQQLEVLDIDKLCRTYADTGQCFCRHRRTLERISMPYEECVSRARKP